MRGLSCIGHCAAIHTIVLERITPDSVVHEKMYTAISVPQLRTPSRLLYILAAHARMNPLCHRQASNELA
jgi:hypothetical protein